MSKYQTFLRKLNVKFEFSKNLLVEDDLKVCKYVLSNSRSIKEITRYCGNKLV